MRPAGHHQVPRVGRRLSTQPDASRPDGFMVWYETDDAVVGVLIDNADDDYDLGERLIVEQRPAPAPMLEP
jgi:hypothetical protein